MNDLRPGTTLGLYALALAVVFAGALGIGRAVGPVGALDASAHPTGTHQSSSASDHEQGGHR